MNTQVLIAETARLFKPLSKQQVAAILSKTAKETEGGTYELFKTTQHFDSTAQHPEWLGGETERTRQLGSE